MFLYFLSSVSQHHMNIKQQKNSDKFKEEYYERQKNSDKFKRRILWQQRLLN
jgi:hypothetical protein